MQDGGQTEEQTKQKPAILAGTGTLQSVPFMERPPPPARPMTKLKPQKVATARQASAGKFYDKSIPVVETRAGIEVIARKIGIIQR